MAVEPIKDGTFLFGGVDISGNTNEFNVTADVAASPFTNFASGGWREVHGTLRSADWTFSGFLPDTTEPELYFYDPDGSEIVFGSAGAVPVTATITRPAAEEDDAFMMRCVRVQLTNNMPIDLHSYNLQLQGQGPMVKGQILGAVSAATSSSTTTGFQLGAASATQKIYASLHATAISTGDTLDVVIESDDNSGFTSATTRFTFTQVTDAATHAEEYLTLAGAVTDDWWRVNYTIAGTDPSFDFTVFLGIQ